MQAYRRSAARSARCAASRTRARHSSSFVVAARVAGGFEGKHRAGADSASPGWTGGRAG